MEKLKSLSKGLLSAILVLIGTASCGEISTLLTDLNQPPGNTAVVLGTEFTDPVGHLNVISINEPRTVTSNVQTTHSDAAVRSFRNTLYVVNRLGADNIQTIDPNADFSLTKQFSVGKGTNPQDIFAINTTKAYVSLYQPEDNLSPEIKAEDVLIVNPSSGEITGGIDLTSLTADDGERFARAATLIGIDDRIFVAVQDLPADLSLPPNQPGKVAVIETETDTLVGSITLSGRNPLSMSYSEETKKLYVANADFFDISSPFGGVEVVDPETLTSEGILVDDADLGGSPGDLEIDGEHAFITVGFFDSGFNFVTKVIRFHPGQTGTPELKEIYRSDGFIQDIAIDETGLLLVGDRDPAVNGILFLDPESGEVVGGPVNVGSPPSSITFVNLVE